MTILSLITTTPDIIPTIHWGINFAISNKQDLKILILEGTTSQDEILNIDTDAENKNPFIEATLIELKKYSLTNKTEEKDPSKLYFNDENYVEIIHAKSSNFETLVVGEIKKHRTDLLIGIRHVSKNGRHEYLDNYLFKHAHCHIILLRPGTSKEHNKKILIPTSGGPHAKAALIFAEKLAKSSGGVLTPLYIEIDSNEVSKEIGDLNLKRNLKKCNIKESDWVKPKVIVASGVKAGIQAALEEDEYDLILIGASDVNMIRRNLFGTIPDYLLGGEKGLTTGVIRSEQPLFIKIKGSFEKWLDLSVPQLDRQERVDLFDYLQTGSKWNFDFLALISLSTIIATVGLLQNSAAVVIGAMLVAPLMTPILGVGLALVQGALPLMRQATKSIILGFLTALGIGVLVGSIVPINHLSDELLARGGPNILDLVVAFFSGIAAAHCTSRPGLSGALPGVAIAAALVPPIATAGVSLVKGEFFIAQGAALLFGTNVVAIILGSAFSFYCSGIRGHAVGLIKRKWVINTLFALSVITLILFIPLGYYFYKQLNNNKAQIINIDDTIKSKISKKLAESSSQLIKLVEIKQDDLLILEIHITTKENPTQLLANELATITRTFIGKKGKIRIIPTITIDSQN
ncbi:MAG: TIGR00341 family protein [Planctomycetota bacterium]|nr:MAG: TIGR00341 family protein [Planctomycetota bacterium]